jgi:hypothetical protein
VNLPDPVLRYVLEARPLHESLRRALIQLSGFLLKRLTAERDGIVDFAPVEGARTGLGEAGEGLRGLRAPFAAAHHRLHLEGAANALERGLAAALSRNDPSGDALFHFLEEAERHLRAASRALPGFEAVDLTQACCAAHSQPAALAPWCFS